MEHVERNSPGRSLAAASPAGSHRTDPSSRQNQKSPILKALRLLEHLAHSSAPVALADLTRSLQLPKPTSHRLAGMLERIGYVQKDPLTLRYCVGPALEELSLLALRNGARTNKRRLLMEDLAERLGVRVNFAVLKSGKLMLVEWVDSVSLISHLRLRAVFQFLRNWRSGSSTPSRAMTVSPATARLSSPTKICVPAGK